MGTKKTRREVAEAPPSEPKESVVLPLNNSVGKEYEIVVPKPQTLKVKVGHQEILVYGRGIKEYYLTIDPIEVPEDEQAEQR